MSIMNRRYAQRLRTRYRLIFSYVGWGLIALALAMIFPLAALPFQSDFQQDQIAAFLLPMVGSLAVGALFILQRPKGEVNPLSVSEGGVIVLFMWMLAPAISTYPFLRLTSATFSQALFETVSSWTTTGLSVIDPEHTLHILLLWRSWMSWLGGLGLVMLVSAALVGASSMGLYQAEARSEQLRANLAYSTRLIVVIYAIYTLIGGLLYRLAGLSWFDAINHTFVALSTGGLSTRMENIAAFDNVWVAMVSILLMILGAVSFPVHYALWRRQWSRAYRDGETRIFVMLLLLGTGLLTWRSLPLGLYRWYDGLFQAVSALTTTGFSTATLSSIDDFGLVILILLMFVGGGAFSTAGGIKLWRAYLLLKTLRWQIRKYQLPRTASYPLMVWRAGRRREVSPAEVQEMFTSVAIQAIFFALGLLMLVGSGISLRAASFDLMSALSTVGLSVGAVGPDSPPGILAVFTAAMALGRLEFLVVFFAGAKFIRDLGTMVRKD